MACSIQTFFKFYLKDVVGIADPEAAVVRIALFGQLSAAVTAIPSGLLSDKIGRMRKPFIYAACALLALGNIANCLIRSESDAYKIACLLGFANGIYLTMDAALALDHLPSTDESARFMGVWGIGCFLGAALGPVLGGPLLALSGRNSNNPDAYNYSGYVLLLSLAAVGFGASGGILYKVGSQTKSDDSLRCGVVCMLFKQFALAKLHFQKAASPKAGNAVSPWTAGASVVSSAEHSPSNSCNM